MTGALPGSDEGESGAGTKENFIGKVIYSDPDQVHEDYRPDDPGQYSSDFEHIALIEPLTVYDKRQNVLGMNTSTSWGSKWMVFVGHLENAHGDTLANLTDGTAQGFADFLEGNVYEWRDVDPMESYEFTWEQSKSGKTADIENLFDGMTNMPNNFLVPVRHVDDPDELEEHGEEGSMEVDNVDF